jgi:hypothetical protein
MKKSVKWGIVLGVSVIFLGMAAYQKDPYWLIMLAVCFIIPTLITGKVGPS